MNGYKTEDICICGGLRIIEINYDQKINSFYCLKCGRYSYEEQVLIDVKREVIQFNDNQHPPASIKISGGGYGTARIITNKQQYRLGFETFEECKECLTDVLNGFYGDVNEQESYIYIHNPKINTGEMVFGKGNYDTHDISSSSLKFKVSI